MPYKGLLFLIFLSVQTFVTGKSFPNTTDTVKINHHIDLCIKLVSTNPQKALLLADTILSLSQKSEYRQGIFTAFNIKGSVYLNNYDFDMALAEFRKAMLYANKNDKLRNKAVVLSNIGLLYRYRFMQDSAIYYLHMVMDYTEENNIADLNAKTIFDMAGIYLNQQKYFLSSTYLFQAKEKSMKLHDSTLLMYIHNSFGILYSQLKQFDLAQYNFKKVIEISNTGQIINLSAVAYLNLGELYFNLKKDLDSAAFYYQLSIAKSLPHEKNLYILTNNVNFGNIFFAKKKYDSAVFYYQSVLKDNLIEKYPSRKAAAFVNLGSLYLEIGENELAFKYANPGYKICKDLNLLLFKKNALESLYKLDSLKGNYLDALKHYQEFHTASDSLQSDLINIKIANLEFEKHLATEKSNNELLAHQNEMKSRQILHQKIQIWIFVLGSIILLFLLYKQYRNRIKLKNLHHKLSSKHKDLQNVNEELNTSNETLLQQQEQLKALNISKDKFLAILGHDLKSPFVSLLGMLNILNEDWDEMEDNEKHKTIERLFISSQNNYQLLEDLLNWGKAQQGQIKPESKQFLVYPQLEQVINLFQDQISNKKLNISIEIPTSTKLNTDARLFIQIIQNLINNAIKFTESGGGIRLTLKTIENEIQFCVEDSGIGIPDNKISTIFDLDSDFNRPGTNREKSTGMGLILSKEFAHIINAKLTATSEEGKGSVFCLVLKK